MRQVILTLLIGCQVIGSSGSDAASGDWPMFGRDASRNRVVSEGDPTTEWDVETGKNIKWTAELGTQTRNSPVVADGKVYMGTNNGAGYLERYPMDVDLAVLLCFREKDGQFLWQYSSERHPAGKVIDWEYAGLGSTPLIEGERMWLINNRWAVVCLDTEGFRDGENDGPYTEEPVEADNEADIVWNYDMLDQLGVSPHPNAMSYHARCSIASHENRIYIVTGNGVDWSHHNLPSPLVPSVICLDKNTSELLWEDNSPGENIFHSQLASPLVAEIGAEVQVIVPQGDGWVRSFHPTKSIVGEDGNARGALNWEFDINPKDLRQTFPARDGPNNILATPVLYRNRVYLGSGQEIEHGNGVGRLVCIDPTKEGDISSELVMDENGNRVPHRRDQPVNPEDGEKVVENPNSGLVWEFIEDDDKIMHRTVSTVAAHNGLVIAPDTVGYVHCLDADDGTRYWTADMQAHIVASPLIVNDTIYVADQDGDVGILRLSPDPKTADPRMLRHGDLGEIRMPNPIYSSPIFANDTLYIATQTTLYAIVHKEDSNKPEERQEKESGSSRPRGETLPEDPVSDPRGASVQVVGATTFEPYDGQAGDRGAGNPADDPRRIPNAAYAPTPQEIVERMLELAEPKAGETVYDLGSGDGRILITAACEYGVQTVGYEINTKLVQRSRLKAEEEGVANRVRVHSDDLFSADLSEADVVTLYLLAEQNRLLVPRMERQLKPGSRVISHDAPLPGLEPDRTLRLHSEQGRHTLYLYTTPFKRSDRQAFNE